MNVFALLPRKIVPGAGKVSLGTFEMQSSVPAATNPRNMTAAAAATGVNVARISFFPEVHSGPPPQSHMKPRLPVGKRVADTERVEVGRC